MSGGRITVRIRMFAGQPLQIYGDGPQTRDLIYIDESDAGDREREHRERNRRRGDVLRNFADARKAAAMLGWSAEVSLAEGLRRTVRWAAQTAKALPAVS